MSTTNTLIEEALEEIRPGFDADGFTLELTSVADDGTLTITLAATPSACMDCLMPDEIITDMLREVIGERLDDRSVTINFQKVNIPPA